MPTSTRCGEERNRPTRVLIKTGSPASTSRTWSRPGTHPDELRLRRPVITRSGDGSADGAAFVGSVAPGGEGREHDRVGGEDCHVDGVEGPVGDDVPAQVPQPV